MTTYLRDDLGYLNSRHYAVSSILYDDGRPAAGDIDLVSASFKNDGLLFGEFKHFITGKNEVWIGFHMINRNFLLLVEESDNGKQYTYSL